VIGGILLDDVFPAEHQQHARTRLDEVTERCV
jgi:hypothetical protein